jgi:hypothetical protein
MCWLNVLRLDFDSSISNQSVPLQLPLHLRIEVIHLRLQILSLAARAIDLFVLAIELPAHDLGALVPALGVAEQSITVKKKDCQWTWNLQ